MSKLTPGNFIEDDKLIGMRDAFHVPCVAVESDDFLNPGTKVRFTDLEECNKVRECTDGETPHGIVDPFLDDDDTYLSSGFWVFLMPGIAQQLVHTFEIKAPELTSLEVELERRKQEDPNCSECYVIEDDRIVRY